MNLYEIMAHLRRHENHVMHVRSTLEKLYDEEPNNETYKGMIGYLDHRAKTMALAREHVETLTDYPNADLERELHGHEKAPSSIASSAVKDALESKPN